MKRSLMIIRQKHVILSGNKKQTGQIKIQKATQRMIFLCCFKTTYLCDVTHVCERASKEIE